MSDDYKVLIDKFFIDLHGNGNPVEIVERSELEAMRARAEAAEKTVDKMNAAYLSWCAEKETIDQLRTKLSLAEQDRDSWKSTHKIAVDAAGKKIAELEAKLKIADEYIPVLREKNGRLREKVASLEATLKHDVDKIEGQYVEMLNRLREKVASLERWKIDHERGMRVCGCGASGDDVIKRDYSYECKKCGCSWMSSQQQTDQVCRDNEGLLNELNRIAGRTTDTWCETVAREAIAKFGGKK